MSAALNLGRAKHALAAHEGDPFMAFDFHAVIEEDAVDERDMFEMGKPHRRPADDNASGELEIFPARSVFDFHQDAPEITGQRKHGGTPFHGNQRAFCHRGPEPAAGTPKRNPSHPMSVEVP